MPDDREAAAGLSFAMSADDALTRMERRAKALLTAEGIETPPFSCYTNLFPMVMDALEARQRATECDGG